MHKIQKIRGHLKMLEFQQLKLERFLKEEIETPMVSSPNRKADIERALKRVNEQIALWKHKLELFENLPIKIPSRGSVLDNDPGRPLIG